MGNGHAITPDLFGGEVAANVSGYITLSAVALASTVPEPSTYAMLFGGLAMMGLIVRRRKQ